MPSWHTFSFYFVRILNKKRSSNHCQTAAGALLFYSLHMNVSNRASLYFWNAHVKMYSAERRAVLIHFFPSLDVSMLRTFQKLETCLKLSETVEPNYFVMYVLSNRKFHVLTLLPKKERYKRIAMRNTCIRSSLTQKRIEAKFAKESMLPFAPISPKFSFTGIHPCVDVYAIFRFKPMHCLSLGVGKTLIKV